MRHNFQNLMNKKIVILDGAMGTYLNQLGFKGITPEIANIEFPELVEKIHYEYCENGAEIILTNTFGANRRILKRKKLDEKFEEIIEKGVEISLKIKEKFPDIFVAGDIGPTGELLHPYGDLERKEAEILFYETGKLLEKNGVDLLVLETFQDLEELKIAYETLKNSTSLFIVPCLTFFPGKEYRTLMGQKIEDFVKWAEENKISLIGSNCGVSSEEMIGIVKEIRKLSNIELWIKPNAGKPKISGNGIEYEESIEKFGNNCKIMVETGVKFIGGCCGTTPGHIKYLKDILKR